MGCGKTTIAKKLATLLNQNFVDTDELIIKNCNNMSITEIFSCFSEGYFRSLETQVLTRLALTKNTVVSLGGGTLDDPENYNIIKNTGTIVYLNLSFSSCYDRIKNDTNRPLVTRYSKKELETLFNKRDENFKNFCSLNYNADKSVLLCARDLAQLINN